MWIIYTQSKGYGGEMPATACERLSYLRLPVANNNRRPVLVRSRAESINAYESFWSTSTLSSSNDAGNVMTI